LRRHIRREVLPAPGGLDELLDWGADFWSQQLSRRKPLWEIVLLEGLDCGRWALVTKTHHSIADGIGAVDTVYVLLDPNPHFEPSSRPSVAADEPPGGLLATLQNSALLAAARGLTGAMVGAVRAGVDVATSPAQIRELLDRAHGVAEHIARDQLVAAPRTSLTAPITPRRRLALVQASLDDMKAVKAELGGTVNDVALAAVTGGLLRLFEHRGETPPADGMRAMVPVNIRVASDDVAKGNQISSLFVRLPTGISDPLRRYRQIVEETANRKASNQALGISTLMDLTSYAPPMVHSVLASALYSTRLFNLGVTNVPGPPFTLYAFGVPLHQIFGFVPLGSHHPLNVGILSYDGKVNMTLVADPEHVTDLEVMQQGLIDALAELTTVARAETEHAPAVPAANESGEREDVSFRAMTAYLDQNAVDYFVIPATPDGDVVAAAIQPAPARAVLLRDGDEYRVALLPAAEQLDVNKAERALGADGLREARIDELRRDFAGHERHADPPTGRRAPAPEVIDPRLVTSGQISCLTDDHRHSIVLDTEFLVRLAEARVADICA
jgi:diacylglycerol O-acyltransferase / wax synthase